MKTLFNCQLERLLLRIKRARLAGTFFKKPPYDSYNRSAVYLKIRAESTQMNVHIDQAVLNGKDPMNFWKKDHPLERIVEIGPQFEHTEGQTPGSYSTMAIRNKEFSEFMINVKRAVKEDEMLIGMILSLPTWMFQDIRK
jgi:hypothetical protein